MYKITKAFNNRTVEVISNIETLNEAILIGLNSRDAQLVSISNLNINEVKVAIIPNLDMVCYS